MSRDFARTQRLREEEQRREPVARRKPTSRKTKQGNGLLMLAVGTLIGFVILLLIQQAGLVPEVNKSLPPASPAVPVTADVKPHTAPEPARAQPQFEFYSQLPAGGSPAQSVGELPAAPDMPTFPEVQLAQPALTPDASAESGGAGADASSVAVPVDGSAMVASAEPVVSEPAAVSVPVAPEPIPAQTTAPAQTTVIEAPVPQGEPTAKSTLAAEVSAPPAEVKVSSPAAESRYYLQVGAFKSNADVERLRAQLAFMGLSASVRSGKDGAGQPVYRVVVGPFSTSQAAQPTKEKLSANGVSSFVTR